MTSTYLEINNHLRNFLMHDFDFQNQTSNYASHNFHSFPAKFPPQLPRTFIEEFSCDGEIILDPMVGSGTTALEAYLLNRKGLGFDIDPLALLISRVKTTHLCTDDIVQSMKSVVSKAQEHLCLPDNDLNQEIEGSFDHETKKFIDTWFLPISQKELFVISKEIQNIDNEDVRDFLKVAFSSIIITKTGGVSLALDLGHTRPHLAKKVVDQNGSTVYGNPDATYPSYSMKSTRSVFSEFEKRCYLNIKGLIPKERMGYKTEINFGDAQSLPIVNDSIDLIITSPPYASNAIDYMRAHKFSLVWFGYSIVDLSKKRNTYIGAEATSKYLFSDLPEYPQIIVEKIKSINQKKG